MKQTVSVTAIMLMLTTPGVAGRIKVPDITISEPSEPVNVLPGVSGSQQCDNSTLGQSENNSTSNIEAIWVANKYNIVYDCGNGIAQNANSVAIYGNEFTFSYLCFKGGYTFSNWSCVDKNNNSTTYNENQTIVWNRDSGLRCTAQYTPNTINIDWYSDNVQIAQNSCVYDSTITLPVQPSKTGYTFNGWLLIDECKDLNSQSSCNANMKCFWHGDNNECVNISIAIGKCEKAPDQTSCEELGYCEPYGTWSIGSDKPAVLTSYEGCGFVGLCGYMNTEESCNAREQALCIWNSETGTCGFKKLNLQ